MIFQDIKPYDRFVALNAINTGSHDSKCHALIALALHEPDSLWVEELILSKVNEISIEFTKVAITCLGHLARLHQKLNLSKVVPILFQFRLNPELEGSVDDALSDILIFMPEKAREEIGAEFIENHRFLLP